MSGFETQALGLLHNLATQVGDLRKLQQRQLEAERRRADVCRELLAESRRRNALLDSLLKHAADDSLTDRWWREGGAAPWT